MPTGVPLDTNPKFVSEVIFEPASQMMAFTLLNEDFGRKLRLELNITDDSITVALMVNPERMNHSANEGISGDDHYARWWDVERDCEELRIRQQLLQTILEDIDTFVSIAALRRNLTQWKHTHLVAFVARELVLGSTSSTVPPTERR
ncbi:hypothetical protein BJ508DRAFT_334145 [Ascobolus immersus RN42]|uniref:Uncharacterized protein n=1 Tax=Ascobolus immersus RN42 TaxID=1160509 RepID=A0A3N4HKH3_ASCIM|nr:hypothetical protein BJ508DRAFT_334145 [Ascobolus immersus RN42]